ncbi:hypothetical protein D3C80_1491720 [compost metagenome]
MNRIGALGSPHSSVTLSPPLRNANKMIAAATNTNQRFSVMVSGSLRLCAIRKTASKSRAAPAASEALNGSLYHHVAKAMTSMIFILVSGEVKLAGP